MSAASLLEAVVDRLSPHGHGTGIHDRKRIRLFVLSHMFGPILGLPIPFLLLFLDPQPYPHVPILAASVLLFWVLFLPLVKLRPQNFNSIAMASIANLSFAVLWGAYNYGGASSPFLLWYILIPLLAFFYLGSSRRAKIMIFGQIVLGLGAFYVAFLIRPHGFPDRVPIEDMVTAGMLSVFCSTTYAFLMAAYYSRVVDSRSELIKEVKRHQATLSMLTDSMEETERARTLAEARNVELETAKERLEYSALHDALTGLPNRRYLDQMLEAAARECARLGGMVALLHVDLDRFKQINDTLGHQAGDAMLIHTAKLLTESIAPQDFVARVGGDEFVIVCHSRRTTKDLVSYAEGIIAKFSRPVPYKGHLCRFGACVGISIERGDRVEPGRLLVNSDLALYRAKARGRNRAELFSEDLQAQVARTNRIADDILRGLEQGEFFAHYQPQVDARTFDIVGVEALVRWRHPTDGILSPAAFLQVAEELNVVGALDRAILEQALRDQDEWRGSGVNVGRISVNVSARRLNDEDLIEDLRDLEINPGALSFELVESIFLDDTESSVEQNIEQIRDLGIDIEIDDFGTGHASIVSLLKLSPARLKIDRQFVSPITRSPEHARLIGSIIEIGKSLDIEVIAEGVEEMAQALMLRELGCDILQGYLFSPPVAADKLPDLFGGPLPRDQEAPVIGRSPEAGATVAGAC